MLREDIFLYMSKQSEADKVWRNNCKLIILNAMGGKCVVCGYNKCPQALAMHHLIPSEKDFQITNKRVNAISWKLMVNELKKCVLLCHNCHTELHSGMINLPQNYHSFNEEYADYKKIEQFYLYLKKPIKMV
jgi:hypothetical protein